MFSRIFYQYKEFLGSLWHSHRFMMVMRCSPRFREVLVGLMAFSDNLWSYHIF